MNKTKKERCTRTINVLVHTFLFKIKILINHFFPSICKGVVNMGIFNGTVIPMDVHLTEGELTVRKLTQMVEALKLLPNSVESKHAVKVLNTVIETNKLLCSGNEVKLEAIQHAISIFDETYISTDILTKSIIPIFYPVQN